MATDTCPKCGNAFGLSKWKYQCVRCKHAICWDCSARTFPKMCWLNECIRRVALEELVVLPLVPCLSAEERLDLAAEEPQSRCCIECKELVRGTLDRRYSEALERAVDTRVATAELSEVPRPPTIADVAQADVVIGTKESSLEAALFSVAVSTQFLGMEVLERVGYYVWIGAERPEIVATGDVVRCKRNGSGAFPRLASVPVPDCRGVEIVAAGSPPDRLVVERDCIRDHHSGSCRRTALDAIDDVSYTVPNQGAGSALGRVLLGVPVEGRLVITATGVQNTPWWKPALGKHDPGLIFPVGFGESEQFDRARRVLELLRRKPQDQAIGRQVRELHVAFVLDVASCRRDFDDDLADWPRNGSQHFGKDVTSRPEYTAFAQWLHYTPLE